MTNQLPMWIIILRIYLSRFLGIVEANQHLSNLVNWMLRTTVNRKIFVLEIFCVVNFRVKIFS